MQPDDRLDQRIIEAAGFRQRLDRLGPIGIAVGRDQARALAERTNGFRERRKEADDPLRRMRERDLVMQIVAHHDRAGRRSGRRVRAACGPRARGSTESDDACEATRCHRRFEATAHAHAQRRTFTRRTRPGAVRGGCAPAP